MKNHPFPIPSVNHILANLADGKFFAKIDLAQAYLQLRVDDASAEPQTIVTHRGAFKVNRLQFGVNVAPGLFQNFIEDLLKGIPGVFPYFDDVLIFAATEEQLCNHLRLVLERLSESGIRANKNKCIFKTKAVEFLGFVIDASGIHPSDSKVRAIHEAPRPKNKIELQAFLGLLNFYHSFLKDKATIAEPLHRLLEKNAEWKWTSAHEKAFAAVRNCFLQIVCYVLSHLVPDGREAPIAYASRTLTSTERNYSQLDKEALSIIAGVKKFHSFLYGHTFTLVTDHQPLLGLFNKMKLTPDIISPRMLRWSQMLNAYDFTIIHHPGKKIQNADALSRLPLEIPETDIPSPPEVLFLEELHNPPVKADEISQATLRDPVLSRVLNWVLKGWPESAKECRIFYLKRHELSVHKNCLLWGNRVVIPEWPKIEEDIENHVGLCEPCQQTRHAPPRAPVHPWEVTTKPWSRVHIDFAGPFQGQMFFLLVDSFSKWLEVKRLSSATSNATIKVMREIFATHGIPDSVASDNGSQYTSEEFQNFLSKNGIRHILVAPYHPSSNGQAERVVQTTKDALKRIISGDWNRRLTSFLLTQHITPSAATGFSPAELLMKRRLRTVLDLLHPDLVEDRKRKNEELLDQRLSKGQLRSFSPNDAVNIKNHSSGPTWIPGTVIEKTGPLSYKNVTPDGKSVRCHIDQMRNRKTPLASPQFSPETQENSTTPVSSSAIPSSSNTPIQPSDPPAEIETPKKAPDESHQSRSRRAIIRPSYLKDYVM
ncbi:Transposon Tf2-11 polyprotein [Araneus ventricosus]|uniref:RNA-directed DNA polymerase n=2 Tax=Araneus ventricosus TaxID=182803 RepID=A0A4Y2PLP1_ARAVE|nr:Transposon Tf2-11 polyprotein [Araneus ventricosus]